MVIATLTVPRKSAFGFTDLVLLECHLSVLEQLLRVRPPLTTLTSTTSTPTTSAGQAVPLRSGMGSAQVVFRPGGRVQAVCLQDHQGQLLEAPRARETRPLRLQELGTKLVLGSPGSNLRNWLPRLAPGISTLLDRLALLLEAIRLVARRKTLFTRMPLQLHFPLFQDLVIILDYVWFMTILSTP